MGFCSTTCLHRSKVTIWVRPWHTHGWVDWWRGSRAVGGSCRPRVVLAPAPAEADSGITYRISLHLVDCHFGGMALDELHETATFARRNLDVGDLPKSLEEGAEFVLGDVSGQTPYKDSGVVGVGELVHGLRSAIETHLWGTGTVEAHLRRTTLLRHIHTSDCTTTLILGRGGRNAHRSIPAVDTLHLLQSLLLVILIGEADEAVSSRHATDWVGHNLGGFASLEFALEQRA